MLSNSGLILEQSLHFPAFHYPPDRRQEYLGLAHIGSLPDKPEEGSPSLPPIRLLLALGDRQGPEGWEDEAKVLKRLYFTSCILCNPEKQKDPWGSSILKGLWIHLAFLHGDA